MRTRKLLPLALVAAAASLTAQASSHREAPFIAQNPSVDGTDFYMFRSYEAGRAGYVTILANYNPLHDVYGGPNYFALNPNALYEIHIDNNGDAVEDLTFQFRFTNTFLGLTATGAPVNTANPPSGANLPIPLINLPPSNATTPTLNRTETYTVDLIRGPRRATQPSAATKLTNASGGGTTFTKPLDNIGNKSIPNYTGYIAPYIYTVNIPGCATSGRVFVGQRKEGFAVNLGEIFDLINLNPLGARTGSPNSIDDKNITTIALEIPVACLTTTVPVTTNGTTTQVPEPVIGGWTTASLRQARVLNPTPQGPARASGVVPPEVVGGAWTQVSRLGSPLVNEVVIGVPDKDRFNSSSPRNDVATFGNYVLTPTLPVLVNALFQVPPPATPRIDLLNAFVTGIQATLGSGANAQTINFTHPQNVLLTSPFTGAGEMLRLNTAFPTAVNAVAPAPTASGYSDLGFLACDLNGFPNGRRPTDDIVDIELTVAEGALTGANNGILQTCDLSSGTPTVHPGAIVNDGVRADPAAFLAVFPYLGTPIPGSPNGPAGNGLPADQ